MNNVRDSFLEKLVSCDYTDTPFPHCVIENVLDEGFAKKCQQEILNISVDMWDRYDNPFEKKYTLRDKNNMPAQCACLFNILTSHEVVNALSKIVRYPLMNDPTKNWWGIHTYKDGDFLDIHSDAGNHPISKHKKHVTLGIYLSHDWKEENGGHLEIWDGESVLNDDAKLTKCYNRILPSFNKMIVFTNTLNAWHGNPDPVVIHNGEKRIFVTVSYVSEDHEGPMANNREKAFFVNRPGDPIDEKKEAFRLIRADPNRCKYII
jgi:hypothetical protein